MDRISIVIDKVDASSKGRKGVSFYSIKEGTYVFIETTECQRFKIKCAINLKAKVVYDEYIDVLNI
jgi:hypothetical protein